MERVSTTVQKITENGPLNTKNANEMAFINSGATEIFINNVKIGPGQTLTIGHHFNEIDITQYNVRALSGFELTLITKIYHK